MLEDGAGLDFFSATFDGAGGTGLFVLVGGGPEGGALGKDLSGVSSTEPLSGLNSCCMSNFSSG